MTNQFSPEPTPPQQPRRDDEWVAVVVALAAIAAILFWVLGKKEGEFGFKGLSALFAPASTTATSESPSTAESLQPGTESTSPIAGESEGVGQREAVAPNLPEPPGRTTPAVVPAPADGTVLSVPSPAVGASSGQPAAEMNFSDVPKNYWAYGAIAALAERGIVAGFPDKTFQPDKPINRAEFAALVREAFQQNPNRNTIQFKDIPADFWANSDINQAVQMGFMKGYPGQVFSPSRQISRLEALVALSSGLNLQPPDNAQQTLQKYADAQKVPVWATNAIAAASDAGLTVNFPDKSQLLEPERPATRADVAALIYQALTVSGQGQR